MSIVKVTAGRGAPRPFKIIIIPTSSMARKTRKEIAKEVAKEREKEDSSTCCR